MSGSTSRSVSSFIALLPCCGARCGPPRCPTARGFSPTSDDCGACREVSDTVRSGLDHTREIASVLRHGLGDTVLLVRADGGRGFAGYAVCHYGAGTEGNSALLFVKAAAVRPGPDAARDFGDLLAACEALAARRGAKEIAAGTNTGRREAYRILRERGYLSFMNAVAMLRPAGEGYGTPGVYAIDDWR